MPTTIPSSNLKAVLARRSDFDLTRENKTISPISMIDPVGLFSGPLSPNYAYIDIRTRSQEDLRERRRVATLAKKEKADRIQKRKRDSRRAEGSVRGILPSAGDHVQHRNMVRQHAINFSDVGDGVFS